MSKKNKMKVTEFSTFYKIKNPHKEGMKKVIENLSTVNYQTQEKSPYAYEYDDDMKILRLPKGVGADTIFKWFNANSFQNGGLIKTPDEIEMNMVHDPFPRQSKVIKDIYGSYKDGKTQNIINMKTGTGKTFTGIYLNHLLKVTPLIFIYNTDLQDQWAEAYLDHTDIEPEQIYLINGGKDMVHLLEHGYEYDVFITTHATIRNFIKKHGYKKFNEFLINTSIGFKIYDEFDRESKNMFDIDFHSSIPYSLYLSATPFRSSKWDDAAFQLAFKDVDKVGLDYYKDVEPNRLGEFIFYYSSPSKEEEKSCYQWKFNHQWISNKNNDKFIKYFDNHNYHIYLLGDENNYNPKKSFIESIKGPIKDFKESHKKHPERKHIITTGRIDNCMRMKRLLMEEFNIKSEKISIYNSDIDEKDREGALDKPFIVSISKSIGRGLDIENIYGILDIEAFGSGPRFKQLTGRIGRIGGMEGVYKKIIDLSFYNTYNYYKRLKQHFDSTFKKIDYVKIDETEDMEDRLN